MKLEKLQEPFDCDKDFSITEDEKSKKYLAQLKFKFGVADKLNGNNRIYPTEVLQTAFEQFNKKAELRKVLSSADHPMGKDVELKNVSHMIDRVYMDADKNLWAEGGLLRTGSGRDIWAILKSGGKIGSSMRGFGQMGMDNKIESGYFMAGVDFVSVGSFGKDAEVTSADIISESLSVELESDDKKELRKKLRYNEALLSGFIGSQNELEKMIKEATIPEEEEFAFNHFYRDARNSGFDGSRQECRKMFEELKEDQKFDQLIESEDVEAIKEMQNNVVKSRQFNEAIESGFKGTFETWKKIQNKE